MLSRNSHHAYHRGAMSASCVETYSDVALEMRQFVRKWIPWRQGAYPMNTWISPVVVLRWASLWYRRVGLSKEDDAKRQPGIKFPTGRRILESGRPGDPPTPVGPYLMTNISINGNSVSQLPPTPPFHFCIPLSTV